MRRTGLIAALGTWLLIIGAVVAGYAAWQLWGTGVLAARTQDRLGGELEQLLDSTIELPPLETIAQAGPGGDVAGTADTGSDQQAGETTATADTGSATTGGSTDVGSEPGAADAADAPAPVMTLLAPLGSPIARLEVPSAGIDDVVVLGDRRRDLRDGPGMAAAMSAPGSVAGNTVFAGHRTSYGSPFRHLDRVEPGDEITVTTPYGTYRYEVYEVVVVDDSDETIMTQTAEAVLTLYTCHPLHSTAKRLVVRATATETSGRSIDIDPTGSGAPALIERRTTATRVDAPAAENTAQASSETSSITPATVDDDTGRAADGTTAAPDPTSVEAVGERGTDRGDTERDTSGTAGDDGGAALGAGGVSGDISLWAFAALLATAAIVVKELFAAVARRTRPWYAWLAVPVALPLVIGLYMVVERILPAGV